MQFPSLQKQQGSDHKNILSRLGSANNTKKSLKTKLIVANLGEKVTKKDIEVFSFPPSPRPCRTLVCTPSSFHPCANQHARSAALYRSGFADKGRAIFHRQHSQLSNTSPTARATRHSICLNVSPGTLPWVQRVGSHHCPREQDEHALGRRSTSTPPIASSLPLLPSEHAHTPQVVFDKPEDAARAIRKYQDVTLDERVCLIASSLPVSPSRLLYCPPLRSFFPRSR